MIIIARRQLAMKLFQRELAGYFLMIYCSHECLWLYFWFTFVYRVNTFCWFKEPLEWRYWLIVDESADDCFHKRVWYWPIFAHGCLSRQANLHYLPHYARRSGATDRILYLLIFTWWYLLYYIILSHRPRRCRWDILRLIEIIGVVYISVLAPAPQWASMPMVMPYTC